MMGGCVYKMKKLIGLGIVLSIFLMLAGTAYAVSPVAHATDAGGNVKDEFTQDESVYGVGQFDLYTYSCAAADEICSGEVDLYVVNDKQWTGGIGELLFDTGDGVETVAVSGICIDARRGTECKVMLPVTQIWAADTVPGKYDYVIDVDKDGVLGQDDPIDDAYITGFTVLPEFTTMGAAFILLGAGFYSLKKKKK